VIDGRPGAASALLSCAQRQAPQPDKQTADAASAAVERRRAAAYSSAP